MAAVLLGAAGPAGDAGRKHREKNVCFKKKNQPNTKTTPTVLRLETKVKLFGIFLGTVFVLLRTK